MPNPFLFLTVGKIKKPIESFELKIKGNYKEKKIIRSTEIIFYILKYTLWIYRCSTLHFTLHECWNIRKVFCYVWQFK